MTRTLTGDCRTHLGSIKDSRMSKIDQHPQWNYAALKALPPSKGPNK